MTHNHKVAGSSPTRPTNYYLVIVKFNYYLSIMKVKFIIANSDKQTPFIDIDNITIKKDDILKLNYIKNFAGKTTEITDFIGNFKVTNIEHIIDIETIISTYMTEKYINIYIEEIN